MSGFVRLFLPKQQLGLPLLVSRQLQGAAKATHVDTCVQEIFHERIQYEDSGAQLDVRVVTRPEGGYKITWIGQHPLSEGSDSYLFEGSKEEALDMARRFINYMQADP